MKTLPIVNKTVAKAYLNEMLRNGKLPNSETYQKWLLKMEKEQPGLAKMISAAIVTLMQESGTIAVYNYMLGTMSTYETLQRQLEVDELEEAAE